jgi:hypothetical protein
MRPLRLTGTVLAAALACQPSPRTAPALAEPASVIQCAAIPGDWDPPARTRAIATPGTYSQSARKTKTA